jgi:predicted neuraminidase
MQARERAIRRGGTLVAIVLAFAGLLLQSAALFPPSGFRVRSQAAAMDADRAPLYAEGYASKATTPSVHSAAAVAVPGGVLAFWYGGTREGASDVAIYAARYDDAGRAWGPEKTVVTRASAQAGLHRFIRKLGNPVVARDARGRIWLYYVSVSVGGWAMSAINAVVSTDEGATWSAPRRLVTSPFLNISTLVKGRPFLYDDGSVGLPAYHEFAGKFGELLRLDGDGNVVGKTRLSHGRYGIQPTVVARSPRDAVAFLRYSGEGPGRILATNTRDGGITWSEPRKLTLPNPNAAIDALALASGELLLVFNNGLQNRNNLSLALSSDDGATWRVVHAFEDAPKGEPNVASAAAEFSYPWIAQDGSSVHLFYTWQRSHIKHVRFDDDWLRQRK